MGTSRLRGKKEMKLATFAAGCFWETEETFRALNGVIDTVVGFMDRAEVVQIAFDPAQISYAELLDVFWRSHDITRANPGGLERSAVFFHDGEQEAAAKANKESLNASGEFRKPVATEISPASAFERAPEDQQKYLSKQGLASFE